MQAHPPVMAGFLWSVAGLPAAVQCPHAAGGATGVGNNRGVAAGAVRLVCEQI